MYGEATEKRNTLLDCRFAHDTLVEQVRQFKNNPDSALYRFKLKDNKINMHADIATDSDFQSAVLKLRRHEFDLLTVVEKTACKTLILPTNDDCNYVDDNTNDRCMSLKILIEKIKRRRLER